MTDATMRRWVNSFDIYANLDGNKARLKVSAIHVFFLGGVGSNHRI